MARQRLSTPATARDALAATLRDLRSRAGLTQHVLARRVGYSRSTIANAESGDLRAVEFYRRCDEELRGGGRLVAARVAAARVAVEDAQPVADMEAVPPVAPRRPTVPPSADGASAVPPLGAAIRAAPVAEVVEQLRRQWHVLVRTDNLFGPRYALPAVEGELAILSALLPSTDGYARGALLSLSARYAETAAWLRQDAGDPAAALRWTARAIEWAHEVGDLHALSWTLFRRSQLAVAEHDAARVVWLARSARRRGDALPAPMRAAIAQQEAHGHALAGDEPACRAALDEAHRWAAETERDGDARTGRGGFCTVAHLDVQRAACALRLGRPAAAARDLLREAVPRLAPVYRRDRAAALGWLAAAHAALGETRPAADAAGAALDIAEGTGSLRIVAAVRAVARTLRDRREPAVAQLLQRLGR